MSNPKVVLDPGHGKLTNPYPAASGYYEGTQMFKLAQYLKDMLVKSGVDVIVTRNTIDDDPALDVRGKTAGNNNAKLFISLHSDAIGSYVSTTAKGVTMFYSIKDTATNKPFATKYCEAIATLLGTTNRGAQTKVGTNGDYYGVIRNAAASGCKNAFLIEHGFHTNPTDVAKLIDDTWLKKIAVKECELICDYLGVKSTASVSDAKTVSISSTGTATTSSTTSAEKYTLYTEVKTYTTAANASAQNTSLAAGKLSAGTYYVYKTYNGMYNLTKTAGVAGGWINPADNVKATVSTTTATDTVTSAETYTVVTELSKYTTAAYAIAQTNAVSSKLAPGEYYIYKSYGKALNLTTKAGVAGSWVNPDENVAKTCAIKVGDVVIVKGGVGTPIYGGDSYGTHVPITVIAKICTAKSYKVTKITKTTNGFECYIDGIGASIMSDYLEVYTAPATTTTNTVTTTTVNSDTVSIDDLSKELTEILKTEKYAPVYAAIKSGTISNFILEILEDLLEDDSPIDVDTDLVTIKGNTVLTAKQITDYIQKNNPDFDIAIANAYIKLGPIYGISGDIAICQSIVETGWFKYEGSAVTASQHNYCGLGVTSNGVTGCSFATIEQGVEAQLQHLYAYACTDDIPSGRTLYDPRFKYVNRGCAPRWVDLDGKWCAEGAEYGKTILKIYKQIATNS